MRPRLAKALLLGVLELIGGILGVDAPARQRGLGCVVPWRAATAYRMYKSDKLLRQAGTIVSTEGYDMRSRQGREC
jgi:hypothetical protein